MAFTALRETFEESGLLLATSISLSKQPSDVELDKARHAIHQQRLHFGEFLDSNELRADIDSLLPFTQWVTPIGPPRWVLPSGLGASIHFTELTLTWHTHAVDFIHSSMWRFSQRRHRQAFHLEQSRKESPNMVSILSPPSCIFPFQDVGYTDVLRLHHVIFMP